MDDPFKGRYNEIYQFEFDLATEALKEFGGKMEWGKHNYQAFIYTAPELKITFYPHKTKTTGNHSIRVHGSGKKYNLAHALLKIAAGYRNTFDEKWGDNHNYASQIAKQRGREFGDLHEKMKFNYEYRYNNEYGDTQSRRIKQ